MQKGVDIASYQGFVNFDQLKADVAFVIAKATEGTGFTDPTFARNWSEPGRVGLIRGAYHFARPDLGTRPEDEAAFFIQHLGPLNAGDLIALDYEADWGGDVVGWCKRWLDDVWQMTAVRAFIYLNLSLVRGHDWRSVVDAGYPLWLADYDGQPESVPATPWPTVAIKQWTSSGRVAGIQGNVDLNTAFALEDEMTPEKLLAMLNDPAIAAQIDTFKALKEVDAAQAAAIRQMAGTGSHVSDAELARIITVMGVALEKVGADVAPKL